MKNVALLCPGQGAQKVGMGKDLAEAFPAARETFESIDKALGFKLSQVMWDGPEELLTRTDHAQPAILAHSAAVWAVVKSKLAGQVAAAAGHSLGEYSAYVAASALSPAEGSRLVRRRGELMHEAGKIRPGAMAAVLGLDSARVVEICAEVNKTGTVVAANLNEQTQTVISGDPDSVARAGELLKAAGAKRVLPLKVSGAFHSPLMARAQTGLSAALAAAAMDDPKFPVVANASAEPVGDAPTAKEQLTAQLVSPVRWIECAQKLAELAGGSAVRFIEIGPGAVLTGLCKRIVPGMIYTSLGTAAEVQAFMEAA